MKNVVLGLHLFTVLCSQSIKLNNKTIIGDKNIYNYRINLKMLITKSNFLIDTIFNIENTKL
jgi:hypothetical protein